MDWNLRKLWPAAAASLVAFTSFVNAADDTQMRNLENRVSALEQRKGSNGMINPPARPVVKDGVDVFFEGSALWWQASESGLDYALSWDNDLVTPPDYGGKGKFHHPKFKWDWGFKIGAGYNMMHDGWDIFLDWTRFHTRSSHGHCGGCPGTTTSVPPFTVGPTSNPGSVVYPILFPANLIPGSADSGGASTGCCDENIGPGYLACMDWRMRLDMIDLELGREFFVSKWLTLRPYAGVRAAWVRQKGIVTYEGNAISSNPTATQANFEVNLKNNFWGVGPRIGLDAQWGFGGGFSLYSDLGISVVLGKFKIRESQTPTLVPGATVGTVATTGATMSFSEKYTAARAITDLAIGFRYQSSFCDDAYGLTLSIGWEQHMFFSQNQLQRLARNNAPNAFLTQQNRNAFTPVTNQGDLSTQGVTFTARVDF